MVSDQVIEKMLEAEKAGMDDINARLAMARYRIDFGVGEEANRLRVDQICTLARINLLVALKQQSTNESCDCARKLKEAEAAQSECVFVRKALDEANAGWKATRAELYRMQEQFNLASGANGNMCQECVRLQAKIDKLEATARDQGEHLSSLRRGAEKLGLKPEWKAGEHIVDFALRMLKQQQDKIVELGAKDYSMLQKGYEESFDILRQALSDVGDQSFYRNDAIEAARWIREAAEKMKNLEFNIKRINEIKSQLAAANQANYKFSRVFLRLRSFLSSITRMEIADDDVAQVAIDHLVSYRLTLSGLRSNLDSIKDFGL